MNQSQSLMPKNGCNFTSLTVDCKELRDLVENGYEIAKAAKILRKSKNSHFQRFLIKISRENESENYEGNIIFDDNMIHYNYELSTIRYKCQNTI